VDAELEALWTSIALVRDLVLGNVDGPSSLAASLPMVAELLEGRIDTTATSGVCWWLPYRTFGAKERARAAWVWAKCDITDDQADALWPLVTASSDSSASLVPSLFARDPPNDAGSSSGSLIC
jgi:hypothetical protein